MLARRRRRRLVGRAEAGRRARVSDLLDSRRDGAAALLELHISQVSKQLNVVIKRLTVVATIGLPLSVVTNHYWMNAGQELTFPEFPGFKRTRRSSYDCCW